MRKINNIGVRTITPRTDAVFLPYGFHMKATLNGKELTAGNLINTYTQIPGSILARGASLDEAPDNQKECQGIISYGDMECTQEDIKGHIYQTKGISTSKKWAVARKFASYKFPNGAVYFYSGQLIPEEYKTDVFRYLYGNFSSLEEQEKALNNNEETMRSFSINESEVVIHKSMPYECMISYRNVLGLFMYGPLYLNPWFIDKAVLDSDSILKSRFYRDIYTLFSEEIGPELRAGALTEEKRNKYDQVRFAFHMDYESYRIKMENGTKNPEIKVAEESFFSKR